MKARSHARQVDEAELKRVGKSGQISIGKQYAGQYFRQVKLGDSIVLTTVVVLEKSHWTVRDQAKIKRAIAWAAKHPPSETDLDELVEKAARGR